MSERPGNIGTDAASAGAKFALGKVMVWLFGSVGSVVIIPVLAILVVAVLAGGAGHAQEKEGNTAGTGGAGTGTVCVPGGESNIPEPYREVMAAAAAKSKIPISILAAQIESESNWDPSVVSPVGASGIAQFMPGTWATWGNGADPHDPIAGLKAQGGYMEYLRKFMQKNFGMWDEKEADVITDEKLIKLILAGYNAGEGNVQEFAGVPPFEETRKYIDKILTLAQTKYSDDCDMTTVGDIGSGKWMHPNSGASLTSPFGPRDYAGMSFHYGLDLAVGGNAVVVAPVDMEITFARDVSGAQDAYDAGYGTWLIGKQIDAPGYVFEFHHFVPGSLKVQVGQKVAVGTPLAVEGTTGNSGGVHLHFQMAPPGTDPTRPTMNSAIDPLPILRKAGVLK